MLFILFSKPKPRSFEETIFTIGILDLWRVTVRHPKLVYGASFSDFRRIKAK